MAQQPLPPGCHHCGCPGPEGPGWIKHRLISTHSHHLFQLPPAPGQKKLSSGKNMLGFGLWQINKSFSMDQQHGEHFHSLESNDLLKSCKRSSKAQKGSSLNPQFSNSTMCPTETTTRSTISLTSSWHTILQLPGQGSTSSVLLTKPEAYMVPRHMP